ncbi:MAG: hypothetical protein GY841_03235, partial [FCB group bacterium]|nr:hypothetical protein [FCB group bacterium]
MRPLGKFLDDNLIEQIIAEARELLCRLGVTIHNPEILDMLADHGATVDKIKKHVLFTNDIIDKALKTSPSSIKLYDVLGNEAVDLSGDKVNFTPGSAALNLLDNNSGRIRK